MGNGGDATKRAGVLGDIVRAEVQARHGHNRLVLCCVGRRRKVVQHIEDRGGLPPEGEFASAGIETDKGTSSEKPATLLELAVIASETAFQHKKGFVSATKIFFSAQPPARPRKRPRTQRQFAG